VVAASEGFVDFVDATGPYRRELLAHCYRMLGSLDDAEDVVQETYLRAWRAYDSFEGRSSVRTWLYQIATNACLTSLKHHSRRVLPSGLGPSEPDAAVPPAAAPSSEAWLQPFPDALMSDPAALVAARESLRLALIASLQYLPGTQRAVLLLRDVLAFPAAEVAALLGTTTAAVKSTLQRARARLREVSPAPEDIAAPTEPAARTLLEQYIAAFENSDAASLERLLSRDATLEATPWRSWYAGRATCVPYLSRWVLGAPGDWHMRPTAANGQPAALAYVHGRPYGVVVLTVIGDRIGRIVSFQDPALVARFTGPSGGLAG
jgi:RNA polymerase sigma-70 factor (ECF subfamily)